MRLKYKILWFEDEDELVNTDVGPQVERYLDSLGFESAFTHQLNGDNLDRLVSEGDFDLILTDLNLGQDHETGEKLIGHIRDFKILTEVLLYSASTSEIDEIMKKTGNVIERISFYAGLDNLFEKIRKIIDLSVKKVQDVNNMRGLVIAQTIDLENSMEEMALKYFTEIPTPELKTSKEGLLIRIHANKVKIQQEQTKKIEAINPIKIEQMFAPDVLTANDKHNAVMTIINEKIKTLNLLFDAEIKLSPIKEELSQKIQVLKDIKGVLIKFHEEVLSIRNTLAHVKEEKDDKGVPYLVNIKKGAEEIKFNETKYSEIRRNLKKHSANLEKIISHV